jgi:AcrR family transcriptional regulator
MNLTATSPSAEIDSDLHVDARLWAGINPEPARRLLLAALKSFASRGFHGTTTREIALLAGVSSAGLYTHYRSKHDLLFQISRASHEFVLRELQKEFVIEGTPTQRLVRLVRAFTAFHATHHTAARVAQYELRSLLPDHFAVIVNVRDATEKVVREAIRLGVVSREFDVDDVDTTTVAVLSLGIDVARWFNPSGPLTPVQLGDRYAGLALRLVHGAAPAKSVNSSRTETGLAS